MPKILIVEGNSPELVDDARAQRQATAAEHYGRTLLSVGRDVSFEIIEPYRGAQQLSLDYLAQFNGAAFTGAGVHWSTSDARAAPQRQAMESVFAAGLPSFGSCNGLQLATVVLGGTSQAATELEIGVAQNIQLTKTGLAHPLHTGRVSGFGCVCIHRDQIGTLPQGAVVTAENSHSIQAMVYEQDGVRFWGTQYHPELSLAQIADYLRLEEGIFSGRDDLLSQIEMALSNPRTAGTALGSKHGELEASSHQTELRNWLRSL